MQGFEFRISQDHPLSAHDLLKFVHKLQPLCESLIPRDCKSLTDCAPVGFVIATLDGFIEHFSYPPALCFAALNLVHDVVSNFNELPASANWPQNPVSVEIWMKDIRESHLVMQTLAEGKEKFWWLEAVHHSWKKNFPDVDQKTQEVNLYLSFLDREIRIFPPLTQLVLEGLYRIAEIVHEQDLYGGLKDQLYQIDIAGMD